MRYRPAPNMPHPALLTGMLLMMVLFMSLLPRLVFANEAEADPLPRYTMKPEEVGEKVAGAIVAAGVADMAEATLELEDPNTIFGSDEPMEVEVNNLNADARNKRWSANVIFRNGEKVLTALPMQGKFRAMIELPSLKKAYRGGEIIRADDIEMQKFPAHYSRSDVITSTDALSGKSARRNISADRPVRTHEVSTPVVVKKNDKVNLTYQSGNLHITTSGTVLTDGAVDDVIDVQNSSSNQIVRAVVRDSRTVVVLPSVQTSALGESHAVIN